MQVTYNEQVFFTEKLTVQELLSQIDLFFLLNNWPTIDEPPFPILSEKAGAQVILVMERDGKGICDEDAQFG